MSLKEKLLQYVLAANGAATSADAKKKQRKTLQEALEDAGLQNFKAEEGPSCSLVSNIGVSVDKTRIVEAMKWLRDNGHGDLIVTMISSDGLTSMVRQATKEGTEPEGGWPEFLKVSTYNNLRVNGANYGK